MEITHEQRLLNLNKAIIGFKLKHRHYTNGMIAYTFYVSKAYVRKVLTNHRNNGGKLS